MDYDIFVSYSRTDNDGGWVDGLVEFLKQDHRRYSTTDLRVYLDTRELRVGSDWKLSLRQALRGSRVLLACVSPNYFSSEYCQFEWEEFHAYRSQHDGSAETTASIYFVEVGLPDRDQVSQWREEVARVQHLDVQPWFPQGRAAFAEDEVRQKLAELGDHVWEQVRAASLPNIGNLRRHNEMFVGRSTELSRLREQVMASQIGVVTAVHGFGGQGKTELAITYAHVNRAVYGAGAWVVPAAGASSMGEALALLAGDLGLEINSDGGRDLAARRVLSELEKRAAQSNDGTHEACLVILDNVDDPGVLSKVGTSMLGERPWLHLIATTRLGEPDLGMNRTGIAFVGIDGLGAEDVFRLLVEHQPGGSFDSAEAEREAHELARYLSGFTLAAEQAAVHLGASPGDRPALLLEALQSNSRMELDEARLGTLHEGTLGALLEQAVDGLSARAQRALTFAALLPPDAIWWEWLEDLSIDEGGDEHSWARVQRLLEGRRLVTPGDVPGQGVVHPLVHDYLATRFPVTARTKAGLASAVANSARRVWSPRGVQPRLPRAIVSAAAFLLDQDDLTTVLLRSLDDLTKYVSYAEGLDLAMGIVAHRRGEVSRSPAERQAARALADALGQAADFVRRADPALSERMLAEKVELYRGWARADPGDMAMLAELQVVLNSTGSLQRWRDPGAARELYQEAVEVARLLVQRGASPARSGLDLPDQLVELARVLRRSDPQQARLLFGEAIDLRRSEIDDVAPASVDDSADLREMLSSAVMALGQEDSTQVRQWSRDLVALIRPWMGREESSSDPALAGAIATLPLTIRNSAPDLALAYEVELVEHLRAEVSRRPSEIRTVRDLVHLLRGAAMRTSFEGDHAASRAYYDESLNLSLGLVDANPYDVYALRLLEDQAVEGLRRGHWSTDPAARDLLDEVLERVRAAVDRDPVMAVGLLASCLHSRANELWATDPSASLECSAELLELARDAEAEMPGHLDAVERVAAGLVRMALALRDLDSEKASSCLREAIVLRRGLVRRHPDDRAIVSRYADVLTQFAVSNWRVDPAETSQSLAETANPERALVARQSESLDVLDQLRTRLLRIGNSLLGIDPVAAKALFGEALDISKAMADVAQSRLGADAMLLHGSTVTFGINAAVFEKCPEATRELYERVLAASGRSGGKTSGHQRARIESMGLVVGFANSCSTTDRREARELYDEALEVLRRRPTREQFTMIGGSVPELLRSRAAVTDSPHEIQDRLEEAVEAAERGFSEFPGNRSVHFELLRSRQALGNLLVDDDPRRGRALLLASVSMARRDFVPPGNRRSTLLLASVLHNAANGLDVIDPSQAIVLRSEATQKLRVLVYREPAWCHAVLDLAAMLRTAQRPGGFTAVGAGIDPSGVQIEYDVTGLLRVEPGNQERLRDLVGVLQERAEQGGGTTALPLDWRAVRDGVDALAAFGDVGSADVAARARAEAMLNG